MPAEECSNRAALFPFPRRSAAAFAPDHEQEVPMRAISALAACAAFAVAMPAVVHSPAQAQTHQSDSRTIWEKIKGSWSQTKGAIKEQWGKLTDDDLLEIEGRRDQLVGKLQTRYGITREQAEAQVSTWEQKRVREM
jgi:uncharacterized protein YjbJ (UPF0337 family)